MGANYYTFTPKGFVGSLGGSTHSFDQGDQVVLMRDDINKYPFNCISTKDMVIIGTVIKENQNEVIVKWEQSMGMVTNDYIVKYPVNGLNKNFELILLDQYSETIKKQELAKKKEEEDRKKNILDISVFDALVLEQSSKDEIISVLKQIENKDKIFNEWGLGEKISYGKGMTFMFHGGPGTGKTWGAHLIAKAFSRELLVLNPANIQSSEPGGAARNIQQAFESAKKDLKVLFIDECDSLIFNRQMLGMVLASEVNTLLTEIEKFDGICILATNRIGDMDEALERRISLIIEFPFPSYEARKDIWKQLLPDKMPLEEGVSHETLAKIEITGGLIKNVILNAARMAISGGHEHVKQDHFIQALDRIKKSSGKMGKRKNTNDGYGVATETVVDKSEKINDFLSNYKKDKKDE